MKQAKNPSDLLWLNRGISRREQIVRGLIVILIILGASFVVYILFSAEVSAQIYIGYRARPPDISCDQIYEAYPDDKIANAAGLEYLFIEEDKDMTKNQRQDHNLSNRISRTGALPCFCENEAENGASSDQLYTVTYLKRTWTVPICKDQMKYSSTFGEFQIIN